MSDKKKKKKDWKAPLTGLQRCEEALFFFSLSLNLMEQVEKC